MGSNMPSQRVLVMDDDNMILDVAASLLEFLGYEAVTCTNGESAVELYRLGKDLRIPFFTAILDLKVEHGMGGIDAAKAILEVNPKAQLILSSGYSDHHPLCEVLFRKSLPKPYTVDELQKVLVAL
jgi:two-component system, cell cycle sensor histidine kinase and response regulator CckA